MKSKTNAAMWGEELNNYADISKVIINFLQGTIKRIPWSQEDIKIETGAITDLLIEMNTQMLLTLSSQPQVNGVPSNHP